MASFSLRSLWPRLALVLLGGIIVFTTLHTAFPSCNRSYTCRYQLSSKVALLRADSATARELDAVKAAGKRYHEYERNVEGNMIRPMSLAFSSQLAHFQIQRGIVGSIGEIGTYYGKYFFSISTAALPVEPKVAIDIFEDQTKNVDGSGSFVNSTRFREHAANLDVANLHILSQDSSTVTVSTLHARKLPPFRMFSVDGAHYKAATLRDLKLAYCSIRRDGVIVLDDWDNFEWTGVMDASYEFMHQVPDAAPFLYLCNKLYFTTRQHHALYFDFVLKNPCTPCSAVSLNNGDMHPSRYEIMGYKVCMVVSQDCAKWCGQ